MEELVEKAVQKAKTIDELLEDLKKAAKSNSGERYFDIVMRLIEASVDYKMLCLEMFTEIEILAKKIENQEQVSMEEGFMWIGQFATIVSCMSKGWRLVDAIK